MGLDVCIRGAGIVGRTLALLLARDRLKVGLVRGGPPSPSASDVRAYALNGASKELLEQVRAWPDPHHACPVPAMEVHGDDGGEVRFGGDGRTDHALCWIVDVQGLLARLDEAIRFQPLIQWLEAPEPAALTVICEGKASTARAEFGVQYEATPYPQSAIAARLHCEKPHGGVARQWFANGEIMALLPLADADGSGAGKTVALVWSVLAERAAGLAALDPEAFAQQVRDASHDTLGALALASERAVWPLQLARADRWCGPGWALAGDAAHTVHPLAGQGLNLGLADARELARVLHEREYWRTIGDERLLRRYERARKGDVLAMGTATDALQQLFSRREAPVSALRNWGMTAFDRAGGLKDWVVRQAMGRL